MLFVIALSSYGGLVFAAPPEPPRILIDTTYVPSACTTTVSSGGNVQTAINSAVCGDTVCLEAGATFTSNFSLPDKDCTDTTWVTIRTATTDANFVKPGTRVAPADAALMAKLTAGSGTYIITTASDADHYRLIGLEITPTVAINALLELSGGSGNLATQTTNIIIDRCYIHGNATLGSRRGVAGQGAYISVIDSYLSDFKEVGADSQAFASWNGSGPIKLVNNYFEGAGENVMFGGAASASDDFTPSDVEIRRNHFYKPLTWKTDDPSYEGTPWSVKNLFELKFIRRAIIENNLFEQCWPAGQNGYGVVMTVRSDSGNSPWAIISDVLFRNNWIRKADSAFNIQAIDEVSPSEQMIRVEISNNLMTDLGVSPWCGAACNNFKAFAVILVGGVDLVIEHNTSFHPGRMEYYSGFTPEHDGHIIRYNIQEKGANGLAADGDGSGTTALDTCCTGTPPYVATENVWQGIVCGSYPSGNYCPATMGDVGFVNFAGGDFRLDSSSIYDGIGPGGADLGVHYASAGQSFLDLEVQASGTSACLRFGRQGLPATQSCTIRYGASSTTSTSGGSRRTVCISGLTNAQQYAFSVDCGDVDGDIADSLFTAATPSGGDRTVPAQIGAPSTALAALGAARCTLDYDDNAGMSSPTSVQDTTCSSGGTADMTVPAGVTYYRWRWQTSGDAVLATGTPQPLNIP